MVVETIVVRTRPRAKPTGIDDRTIVEFYSVVRGNVAAGRDSVESSLIRREVKR